MRSVCSTHIPFPRQSLTSISQIQIGNSWEYDEPHLTEEGYRAKAIFRIASGMNGEYLMTSSQEFICLRTEDEYNEYVKTAISIDSVCT